MFEPIDGRRQGDIVAHRICNAILDGSLRVGERLPSERALIWQLSVSRPTIREGVRQLVDAGILDVRAGAAGTVVVSDEVPLDFALPAQPVAARDVAGVLEARRMLEPGIAGLAARYGREEDLAGLHALVERMSAVADDREACVALDVRVRIAVARASGNTTLLRLAKQVASTSWHARALVAHIAGDTPATLIEVRRTLRDALIARDSESAARIVDDHLAVLEQAWRREVGRTVARP